MQKYYRITVLILLCWQSVSAQEDSLRKYLDQDLRFTRKASAAYTASVVKSGDHWLLIAYYPDRQRMLSVHFRDRECTIKDGPFHLYHPNGVHGLQGNYLGNLQHGQWISWYPDGQMKDSGLVQYNYLAGTWKVWYENKQQAILGNYVHQDSITLANSRNMGTGLLNTGSILEHPDLAEIKQGLWITWFPNGIRKDSGVYVVNKQHGEWTSRYQNGNIESTGRYDNGLREGTWRFFHENGELATREKYEKNKVASLQCYDEKGNVSGNACSIKKPPVPLGKFSDFDVYMVNNIFWPKELDEGIQGDVKVTFTITKEGKLVNFKAIATPHHLLTNEVLRFFSTLEWSPSISHNRTIDANMEYVVPFYR